MNFLKQYLVLILCLFCCSFLVASVIIEPSRPIVYTLEEGEDVVGSFALEDFADKYIGFEVVVKDKYDNNDTQKCLKFDQKLFKFEKGKKAQVRYSVYLGEDIKKEVAYNVYFLLENKEKALLNEVYTIPVYIRTKKICRNINKLKINRLDFRRYKNSFYFDLNIQNKSVCHSRPKIKVMIKDQRINFYDNKPIYPKKSRVISSYMYPFDFKDGVYKAKIEITVNNKKILKKFKIKIKKNRVMPIRI